MESITTEIELLPEFVPFSRTVAIFKYYRNLPHWRQPGATYFITFRLADSIPARVMTRWKEERKIWAENNGVNEEFNSSEWNQKCTNISQQNRDIYEKRFMHRYQKELDKCQGSCTLQNPKFSNIVKKALLYWHGTKGLIGDLVVMPNHVHALITPLAKISLEKWIGSVKRFSATQIHASQTFAKEKALWQSETYDHIVRDREELARIRRYIKSNPENANISPGQYLYVNAEWMDNWCDMNSKSLPADKNTWTP